MCCISNPEKSKKKMAQALSVIGGLELGLTSFMPAALTEQQQALQLTALLAQRAGGDAAGLSILTAGASANMTNQYCPDPATASACMAHRAYQACYVDGNVEQCREISMLIGTAKQQAADMELANSRKSSIDAYFLQPTFVSVPRNVHRDIAAVSVASKTASRG